MSVRGSFDDRLSRWLDDGPEAAPSDLLEAVLKDVAVVSQRSRIGWWRPPRRTVSIPAGWAVAAAALVILAIVGIGLWSVTTSGPAATNGSATASPSPTARPEVLTQTGPLPAGAYALPAAGAGAPQLVVTIPDGWRSYCRPDCFAIESGLTGGTVGIGYFVVANVYADPCAHVLRDPPLGPLVDDLATALSTLPGTEATTPIATTLDGHRGKYVEITIHDDIDCPPTQHYLWETPSRGKRWAEAVGQHFRLWVVDLDGQRVLVQADWLPDASEADLAALSDVVDSMRFAGSGVGSATRQPGDASAVLRVGRQTLDESSTHSASTSRVDTEVADPFSAYLPR